MGAEGHYAVIVGVERYGVGAPPDPAWKPGWDLNGPYADAAWFARWLVAHGVDLANIRCFANRADRRPPLPPLDMPSLPPGVVAESPTYAGIRKAIVTDLPTKNPSFLWLFWSGHGVMRSGQDARLVLTEDAVPADKQNIDLDALLAFLRTDAFPNLQRVVCVVDACANIVDEKVPSGDTFPPRKEVASRRQYALLASAPTQKAINDPVKDEGLLTRELRGVLPAAPGEGVVWPPDMDAVYDQVRAKFTKLVASGAVPSEPTFWHRYGKGSLRVSGVEDLILPYELPPDVPLQPADLANLDAVLAGMMVSDAHVHALYRQFTGGHAARLQGRASLLSGAAWRLAEFFPRSDGALPSIAFVESLRPKMEPERAAKLDAWLDTLAGRPGVDIAASKALALAVTGGAPMSAILLVKLQPVPVPDHVEDVRYRVRAWLGPEGYTEISWGERAADGEGLVGRAQVADLIGELVESANEQLADGVPLRIELLAPAELFVEPLDEARFNDSGKAVAVGHRLPVVLRAYERCYDRGYRLARERRQKKWERAQLGFEARHVTWAPASAPGDAFMDMLLEDERLGLFAAQLPPDRAAARELVSQLYSSGIPFAVVLRASPGDGVDPQQLLPSVFIGTGPDGWPEKACQARKSRKLPAATILWDNPAHPPPDMPRPGEAQSRRATAPT